MLTRPALPGIKRCGDGAAIRVAEHDEERRLQMAHSLKWGNPHRKQSSTISKHVECK
jgi:hypothetical protein